MAANDSVDESVVCVVQAMLVPGEVLSDGRYLGKSLRPRNAVFAGTADDQGACIAVNPCHDKEALTGYEDGCLAPVSERA